MSTKYTVVQHSGYTYGGNPEFEQAVEPRMIPNVRDLRKVQAAGGVVLDGYVEAEDFCDAANYPPGTEGIVPQARGTFADVRVDSLRVYVPVREVAR